MFREVSIYQRTKWSILYQVIDSSRRSNNHVHFAVLHFHYVLTYSVPTNKQHHLNVHVFTEGQQVAMILKHIYAFNKIGDAFW